jgi:phosphohistidine phosphatase
LKTLLLLRHAKSSWKDASLEDFDRPLTKQGKRVAKGMGKELRRRQLIPDLILSSAARRTQQTAKRVAKTAGYDGMITAEPRLYLTGVRHHLEVLMGVNDAYGRVLLLGHNPDLEDLVAQLTGQEVSLPTGALVGIDLEIDSWSAMPGSSGQLLFLVTPKELILS